MKARRARRRRDTPLPVKVDRADRHAQTDRAEKKTSR